MAVKAFRTDTHVHDAEISKKGQHVMIGSHTEIISSGVVLTLPLLTFTSVLIYFIYAHLMPDQRSSYSDKLGTVLPLGNAYYVNISATRLIFVSSWSSTIALSLISLAMLLSSYPVAHHLVKLSDSEASANLPSPFQLELLISILGGKITSLWFLLTYLLSSKQRRVPIIPGLLAALIPFLFTILLAILINLTDTWLHLSTTSVQYSQLSPVSTLGEFSPGRVFPSNCSNATVTNSLGCIIVSDPGDLVDMTGQDEILKTLSNISTLNQISFSNQTFILGPANSPPEMSFTASSFASSTSCDVVTPSCKWAFTPDPTGGDSYTIYCTPNSAGLFLNISSHTGDESDTYYYYNTSTKTSLMDVGGLKSYTEPFAYMKHDSNLYWAYVFVLPATTNLDADAAEKTSFFNVSTYGLYGILSCTTALSNVEYDFANGTLAASRYTPMNLSTSNLFVMMTEILNTDNIIGIQALLNNQLMIAAKSNTFSPAEFAARFATAWDQMMLALPTGTLLQSPASNITRHIETLVTRVTKAPLFTLIILNLIYVSVGIILTAIALYTCEGGTRDVQARLGTSALIAECFERPDLNAEAKTVDEMFAERHGMRTRRIMFSRTARGGRRYQPVVLPRKGWM